MSEYIPIYQAALTISHSAPAMEANYGNQTIELSNLQNSELLKVDLGSPVLKECNTFDLINFWFTFGNKWFRFHLPEMVLDKVATPLTNNFAYFEHQGLNIYKLYYRTNGYDKLIYFPKDLKIENYTGIIKELDDHTFYLSQDPTGKLITGIYDVPAVFDMKGLTINSTKEDRVSNIRVKEILFGEEVSPPQSLANPEVSILGGTLGSITPPGNPIVVPPNNLSGGVLAQSPNVTTPPDPVDIPPTPVNNSWQKILNTESPLTVVPIGTQTDTFTDVNFSQPPVDDFDENGNPLPSISKQYFYAQHYSALGNTSFTIIAVVQKYYTIYDATNNASNFRPYFYKSIKQSNTYYVDVANIVRGRLASDSASGPYSISLTGTNPPDWRVWLPTLGVSGSTNLITGSNWQRGWVMEGRHYETGLLKVDATQTTISN